MNTNDQGTLGEIKAIEHFHLQGYHIYTGFSGKEKSDLSIEKDNLLLRVQVKCCTRRSPANTGWQVKLDRVRANSTETLSYGFDPSDSDLLFIYFPVVNKYIILNSKEIKVTRQITIFDAQLE